MTSGPLAGLPARIDPRALRVVIRGALMARQPPRKARGQAANRSPRSRGTGGRSRSRRVASRWVRFRRSATIAVVLLLAVLVFAAGLLLDTTAVLRLVFGWIARVWARAPLEISLAVVVIAVAVYAFGRDDTVSTKPRSRRPAAKGGNAATGAGKQRPAGRTRPEESQEAQEPETGSGVAVQQRKRATRRKKADADA
jgi:hypothetical protein